MFVDYSIPTETDIKKWSKKGSISYIGLFIDETTRKGIIEFCKNNEIPLHNNIVCHHITLKFKPTKEICENAESLLGSTHGAIITGYGSDENVTALRVSLLNIQSDNRIPHITVSLGENGQAKMSNDLQFKDINGPGFVTKLGIFGRGKCMDYIPWK
jgi:hypothetical protein